MDEQNIRPIEGDDRRLRRENHQAFMCPRCHSFHTKFCYYNNYNYSQPRHFCKTCRRYWTLGGLLRNIPVGCGSRKSKNSKLNPEPAPAPSVLADSPFSSNSNSNALTSLLSVDDSTSDFGIWSKSERVPFVFSCIEGTAPLKSNRVGDYYGWVQNEGDLQGIVVGPADPTTDIRAAPAEKRARGEGFGSPDLSSSGENEGMLQISSAVDQISCLKFCGLTTNFSN